jgi:hypothetical protein
MNKRNKNQKKLSNKDHCKEFKTQRSLSDFWIATKRTLDKLRIEIRQTRIKLNYLIHHQKNLPTWNSLQKTIRLKTNKCEKLELNFLFLQYCAQKNGLENPKPRLSPVSYIKRRDPRLPKRALLAVNRNMEARQMRDQDLARSSIVSMDNKQEEEYVTLLQQAIDDMSEQEQDEFVKYSENHENNYNNMLRDRENKHMDNSRRNNNESEEDESSSSEQEYEVEDIIAHRRYKKTGIVKYKIRWRGYESDDDTWETENNLQNAPIILAEYKESKKL